MFTLRTLFAFIVLFSILLVSACQPIQAPAPNQAPSAPQGLRPDAPPYAVHGPFGVGYWSPANSDGSTRPMQMSIWYPALNPTGKQEKIAYTTDLKDATIPADQRIVPSLGHALLNAEVDVAKGPYPLVVFSHGFTGSAGAYSAYQEHYASYGFVVLAPEHSEQYDESLQDLWKSAIDRPRNIKQALDYAEALNAPGGELEGMIDMARVAVVGHSYGGYTALAAAGAQYDLVAFNDRCAQLPEDDPFAWICTVLVPNEANMAARAGLEPMPTGLWPSFGDPRVKTIVTMAGDSYFFDQAGLAKITIPVMALGGTADTGTPYDWGVKPTYDYAASEQKALVTFIGGEHLVFGIPCERLPWALNNPVYNFICYDPVWDKARSLDLALHFSTAFLLDMLNGDAAAHEALLPGAFQFPGIEYATTLK
ncbi:MAG: prolyl oligopeptidase family serine peptidase [Caldilineaceae bacterium]